MGAKASSCRAYKCASSSKPKLLANMKSRPLKENRPLYMAVKEKNLRTPSLKNNNSLMSKSQNKRAI